ncbi:glycosyltransferase family 8 protein [Candidatus Saccharibacteria bacterium]|nr:glycosyltransferase family 8 protein [Candidatus Saccharibacteria bacterium]
MDVMYCGDKNILDGLTISVLSLLKHTSEPIRVYVLTMVFSLPGKKYQPILQSDVSFLDKKLKAKNRNSFIKVIDVTELYKKEPATANRRSYFTPYCMLRLYADQIPEVPDKILYLDTDIVCLNDPMEFYKIDNSKYEMVGVLDRYGGKIIRLPFTRQKYINSGVLLLNLPLIRKTGLFLKAREMCRKRWMIMPDQSALNFSVKYKKIVDKKFNDQKEILPETVFRHFSNTFKFFPYFKVIKIKPWDVEKVHDILGYHQFDDVLEEWQKLKAHKEVA